MATSLDETCDPRAQSWVPSANEPNVDFPIQNLPLGTARPRGTTQPWRIVTAIGHVVLDLGHCAEAGLVDSAGGEVVEALQQPTLNTLMSLGDPAATALRRTLHRALRDDAPRATRERVARYVHDAPTMEHALPARVGDFTDFFASAHHALRVARLRNPEASLPFAYPYAPLAYHGRASTLVVSDTPVPRPKGPRRLGNTVAYGPSQRLDYEAELGLLVSRGTTAGQSVPVAGAHEHLMGVCLLNDWSARDIQSFESQPLGPFLSKSFATTVSPWIVTRQALEPFRVPAADRPPDLDHALPYLRDAQDRQCGAWAISLEVRLSSSTMREMDVAPTLLSRADGQTLFWTPAQLIAHHTANGCQLQPGDLLGTGTVSGPERQSGGCLLELTHAGTHVVVLPNGEQRTFLEDGDEVVITASCHLPGTARIGFGECRGRIVPAPG